MGREAMAALLSSVALIARRRRDVKDMQLAWSRSVAALLHFTNVSVRDCPDKYPPSISPRPIPPLLVGT